jgi:hypothetical protein
VHLSGIIEPTRKQRHDPLLLSHGDDDAPTKGLVTTRAQHAPCDEAFAKQSARLHLPARDTQAERAVGKSNAELNGLIKSEAQRVCDLVAPRVADERVMPVRADRVKQLFVEVNVEQ